MPKTNSAIIYHLIIAPRIYLIPNFIGKACIILIYAELISENLKTDSVWLLERQVWRLLQKQSNMSGFERLKQPCNDIEGFLLTLTSFAPSVQGHHEK